MATVAKVIFDKMKEKALADGFSYVTMLRLYRHARMLDAAAEVAEDVRCFFGITSEGFNESEYILDRYILNLMISVYADLRMVSDAEVIFEAMKGKYWADGSMAMFSEAVAIADEMKQSGSLTGIYSFAKLMAVCAARRMLPECGLLLQEMVTERITPDHFMLKILLIALKKKEIISFDLGAWTRTSMIRKSSGTVWLKTSRITKLEYMTSHFLALAVEKDGSGFLFPPLWYYATVLYFGNYYRKDPRERAGLAASAVAAMACTIVVLIVLLATLL
ncbi:Pentatricopeptide repeat-containing protein [Drosera capensis]